MAARAMRLHKLRACACFAGCHTCARTDLCHVCGAARRAAAVSLVRAAAKKEKMMWETLREAIDEGMEAAPAVPVMGRQRISALA